MYDAKLGSSPIFYTMAGLEKLLNISIFIPLITSFIKYVMSPKAKAN
jgi:TM2 domain-containing membrane protein YozV